MRDWAAGVGEKDMNGILELLYVMNASNDGDFIEY